MIYGSPQRVELQQASFDPSCSLILETCYNVATLLHQMGTQKYGHYKTVEPGIQSGYKQGEESCQARPSLHHGSRTSIPRASHSRGVSEDYPGTEEHCGS